MKVTKEKKRKQVPFAILKKETKKEEEVKKEGRSNLARSSLFFFSESSFLRSVMTESSNKVGSIKIAPAVEAESLLTVEAIDCIPHRGIFPPPQVASRAGLGYLGL